MLKRLNTPPIILAVIVKSRKCFCKKTGVSNTTTINFLDLKNMGKHKYMTKKNLSCNRKKEKVWK